MCHSHVCNMSGTKHLRKLSYCFVLFVAEQMPEDITVETSSSDSEDMPVTVPHEPPAVASAFVLPSLPAPGLVKPSTVRGPPAAAAVVPSIFRGPHPRITPAGITATRMEGSSFHGLPPRASASASTATPTFPRRLAPTSASDPACDLGLLSGNMASILNCFGRSITTSPASDFNYFS